MMIARVLVLVDHVGEDSAIDNLGNGGDIVCIDKEHDGEYY